MTFCLNKRVKAAAMEWIGDHLIDKKDHIRYIHIGEGRYAEMEAAIQALLREPETA